MKLQVPFVELPLVFDAPALAAEIAALGEACWRPHPQGYAGNSMLPLVAVGGDPANQAFSGAMRPTRELLACPYATQVLASLGATVGRTRLMRLSGHAEVKRHVDQGYYWAERVRVHVPVVTQPTVRFECGDATINMTAGACWIFDTWRQHRVINDAVESRIHLVVDTVGGGEFWRMVGHGRPHNAPREGWQPRLVSPQPGGAAAFALETANVPDVMTPWELNHHLGMLFAEAVPHPQLGRVQQIAGDLSRTWRGLWARFGNAPEGRSHYRAVLDRFVNDVRQPAQAIALRNDIRWFDAMMALIGTAVTSSQTAAPASGEYGVADNG